MENLHNDKSKFYTHQWIKYMLLEFSTVSEDSDILSHKQWFSTFLIMSNYRKIKRNLENSDGSSSY